MSAWQMHILLALGLIGTLLAVGLGAFWLVIRAARPHRKGEFSSSSAEQWSEEQAGKVAAEIRALNSAERRQGSADGPA